MSGPARRVCVLLVEPQFVLRRTVVSVARDLGVADIAEATSLERAWPILAARPFDGVILDIGSGPQAFDLLTKLRDGGFASDADVAVVALGSAPGFEQDSRLGLLKIQRALRKPFKVGELLQEIEAMPPRAVSGAAPAAVGHRRVALPTGA